MSSEAASPADTTIRYTLTRLGTGQGVGWFSCVPEGDLALSDLFSILRDHPRDQFMRRYALDCIGKLEPDQLAELVEKGGMNGAVLRALVYEASVLYQKFESLGKRLAENNLREPARPSPLIYARWPEPGRHACHDDWLRLFSENMTWHKPLPPPDESGLPIPYDSETLNRWWAGRVTVRDLEGAAESRTVPGKTPFDKANAREMARTANRKLDRLGILRGWESRTEATVSPYAVERPWHLDVSLKQGKNNWRLQGGQVSYGRGLNIHQARISCLMEIVERYSAFCRADEEDLPGYGEARSLVKGTYSELKRRHETVDPNEFLLEVLYEDQELYWMAGEKVGAGGRCSAYVPAQMVFLFANFDEVSLTGGLPSTGLGAGSTIDEARLSGLLEVLERDAEKVVPYSEDRRFLLVSEDSKVSDIVEGMSRKGIQIQFLDLTQEFGIPCYKAFIQGPGGVILKGSAANLDGKRAVVSAMTEIPYPYPYWFGSAVPPESSRVVRYEDLPDFSSGNASEDLRLLEKVLVRNGYYPIYVDLTRDDLEVPVVKVLVPGLELTSVLDRFSPLSLRKFGHYMRLRQ